MRWNAYSDCDLAVGSDERGCGKSNEEDLGEHVCGWSSKKDCLKNKIYKDWKLVLINSRQVEVKKEDESEVK